MSNFMYQYCIRYFQLEWRKRKKENEMQKLLLKEKKKKKEKCERMRGIILWYDAFHAEKILEGLLDCVVVFVCARVCAVCSCSIVTCYMNSNSCTSEDRAEGMEKNGRRKKTPLFIFVLMSCVLCVCVHTGGRYADVCLVLCGIYVNRRVVCTIGDGGKNVWRLISIHIFDIHSLRAMDSFFSLSRYARRICMHVDKAWVWWIYEVLNRKKISTGEREERRRKKHIIIFVRFFFRWKSTPHFISMNILLYFILHIFFRIGFSSVSLSRSLLYVVPWTCIFIRSMR